MDSLSLLFSSSYPLSKTPKPFTLLSNHNPPHSSISSSPKLQFPTTKKIPISTLQTNSPISLQNLLSKSSLSLAIIELFSQFPCLAIESAAPTLVESDAGKISLESILVSIDDFFNRYPFFVAGCAFIWLVVIPWSEEYFRKYKFVSAIDAFRKLRDNADTQLLDIRDRKNVKFLGSPNLKMLNKEVVQVEFSEGNEDGFVKKVLERFNDPPNTVVCVLDSFDGNSMKVAELLFKNGFKEVYAIKGGVRGQQGWMAIQDTLLPPPVHIFRKKKTKASQKLNTNGNGAIQQTGSNNESALSSDIPAVGTQETENGHLERSVESNPEMKMGSVESNPEMKMGSVASSSPYPNYPDLKPPSSPTPSKPQ